MMTSEDNNPAIEKTNRLRRVVIVADHIHMKEVGSPALLLSKVSTSCHNCGTVGHYANCVESHTHTAIVKSRVKAVRKVVIAYMVDLVGCITSYTLSM